MNNTIILHGIRAEGLKITTITVNERTSDVRGAEVGPREEAGVADERAGDEHRREPLLAVSRDARELRAREMHESRILLRRRSRRTNYAGEEQHSRHRRRRSRRRRRQRGAAASDFVHLLLFIVCLFACLFVVELFLQLSFWTIEEKN